MNVTQQQKTEIYTAYHEKVERYIRSKVSSPQVAEDLCADVFVKVYARLDSFDETKAAFSTWLYTIARNTVTDHYRTWRATDEVPETLAAEGSPEDAVCRAEQLETLADALEQLDERSRDLIILRYYSGLTLKAAAQQLGISYAYVKVLHNKALERLRTFF